MLKITAQDLVKLISNGEETVGSIKTDCFEGYFNVWQDTDDVTIDGQLDLNTLADGINELMGAED